MATTTHRFFLALAAVGLILTSSHAQAPEEWQSGGVQNDALAQETDQLREEVAQLQREIAQLRAERDADMQWLGLLSDPELASLAALEQARQLDREQRIEFLSETLMDTGHPQIVRNAAYLMLIEDLQEEGLPQETARLLQRMITENAQEARDRPGMRLGQPIGPRHRFPSTGRGLELELRSPRVYPDHPDAFHQRDRFAPYERYDYGRLRPFREYDFFDRPWFENPRWRPGWWR